MNANFNNIIKRPFIFYLNKFYKQMITEVNWFGKIIELFVSFGLTEFQAVAL